MLGCLVRLVALVLAFSCSIQHALAELVTLPSLGQQLVYTSAPWQLALGPAFSQLAAASGSAPGNYTLFTLSYPPTLGQTFEPPTWITLEYGEVFSKLLQGVYVNSVTFSADEQLAFVTTADFPVLATLVLVSVIDPERPVVVGTVASDSNSTGFRHCALSPLMNPVPNMGSTSIDAPQQFLYVASLQQGLQVWALPSRAELLAGESAWWVATYSRLTAVEFVDVSQDGSLLFTCDQVLGFSVLNASNPLDLREIFNDPNECNEALVMNAEIVIVSSVQSGLQLWNYTNASGPVMISSLTIDQPLSFAMLDSGSGGSLGLFVGLSVSAFVSLQDVRNPRVLSYTAPLALLDTLSTIQLLAGGRYLWQCSGTGGIISLDMKNATLAVAPVEEAYFQTWYVNILALTATTNATASSGQRAVLEPAAQTSLVVKVDSPLQSVISVLVDRSMTPLTSTSFFISAGPLFVNPSPYLLRLSFRISSATATAVVPDIFSLQLDPPILSTIQTRLQGVSYLAASLSSGAGSGAPVAQTLYMVQGFAGIGVVSVADLAAPQTLGMISGTALGAAMQPAPINDLFFVSAAVTPNGRYLLVAENNYDLMFVFAINSSSHGAYELPQLVGHGVMTNSTYLQDVALVPGITASSLYMYITDRQVGGLFVYAFPDPETTEGQTILQQSLGFELLSIMPLFQINLLEISDDASFAYATVTDTFNYEPIRIMSLTGPGGTAKPELLPNAFPRVPELYINGISICGTIVFVAGVSSIWMFDIADDPLNPRWLGGSSARSEVPLGRVSLSALLVQGTALFAAAGSVTSIRDLTRHRFTVASQSLQDAGNYRVSVLAMDALGATASSAPFTLRVEGPPTFNRAIDTQYAKVGHAFNYFIPQGLCTDPNLDTIAFTATLTDGFQLPLWLTFNSISSTFAGVPGDADITSVTGPLIIAISATDNLGGLAHATFALRVNHVPTIRETPPTVSLRIGRPFALRVDPTQVFSAPDLGDALNCSITMATGLTAPPWLVINSTALTVSGTPTQDTSTGKNTSVVQSSTTTVLVGAWNLVVRAANSLGDTVETPLVLLVSKNTPPQVVQPISDQQAQVNTAFKFSVATNTFSLFTGDTLFVNASLSDGSALPGWLSFENTTLTFSGEPSRADTDPFAPRTVTVNVYAYNLPFSPPSDASSLGYSTASFHIVVSGTSWELLTVQILAPIVSVCLTAFTLYRQRALLLNHLPSQQRRYRRPDRSARVGQPLRLTLDTHIAEVAHVRLGLLNPKFQPELGGCSGLCNSIVHPRLLPLQGGHLLPFWLHFHHDDNELRTSAWDERPDLSRRGFDPNEALPVPREAAGQNFVVQVTQRAGIIVEEFVLNIEPAAEGEEAAAANSSSDKFAVPFKQDGDLSQRIRRMEGIIQALQSQLRQRDSAMAQIRAQQQQLEFCAQSSGSAAPAGGTALSSLPFAGPYSPVATQEPPVSPGASSSSRVTSPSGSKWLQFRGESTRRLKASGEQHFQGSAVVPSGSQ